jgi:hypothetical protein
MSGTERPGGKVGYPPMSEIEWDRRSPDSKGIGPSGMARRALLSGRELEEEPAGEQGDMVSAKLCLCSVSIWPISDLRHAEL